MHRLQEGPVHPPRGLRGDTLRLPLPEEAGDLAEAVRVVGRGLVPPAQVDVESALAHVDAGSCHGHVSRSLLHHGDCRRRLADSQRLVSSNRPGRCISCCTSEWNGG